MGFNSDYITTEELCCLANISRLRAFYLGVTRTIRVSLGANGEYMFDRDDVADYFNIPREPEETIPAQELVYTPLETPVKHTPAVKSTVTIEAPNRIILDADQQKALSMIENGENLFITGKAGTGKTVLLNEIRNLFKGKKFVATVAPTGVAAEHANGFTMHSFFRLPMKAYLPGYEVKPDLYKLKDESIEVLKKLEVLLIDEVSMVRCDMMDAMDMILRHYRGVKEPFGGVQMVMFGDLYQLCPVAQDEEKDELEDHYDTMYFFSSKGLKKLDYKVISLETIHRQDEHDFIDLLNNIRVGKITANDLKMLDSHYEPNYVPDVYDDTITLMTHNRKVRNFNSEMYNKLEGSEHVYDGEISGHYRESLPAEMHLKLKVGARVMFLRNDNEHHRYVNGTMGRVTRLDSDSVVVRKDDGKQVQVTRSTWEQLDYHVDKINKAIYTTVSAKYKQLPLKLAWAVSIHKSQGLTFNEAVIDAEKAFTYGQVYVALSRVRTLKGVHLLSRIASQKIKADSTVQRYMDSIADDGKVGNVKFRKQDKESFEVLELNARYDKILRLDNDEIKTFKRSIADEETAQKIFQYTNGKICINDIFKHEDKNWTYKDTNNGHCPFIVRKYRYVRFYSLQQDYYSYTYEIDGDIEVSVNAGGNWSFTIRLK